MVIDYSSSFKRAYKKLPDSIKLIAKKRIAIFIENPVDSRLRTHKLTGSLAGYWAFRVDYRHRVIFSYSGKRKILLHDIGNHSIY